MPSTVWYSNCNIVKDNIKYKYDKCGNIIEITENNRLAVRYEYDKLNRLVKEDNRQLGRVYEYVYDTNGNILNKYTTENGETVTDKYEYEGDKLLTYNGEESTYNTLGNPVKYRNKALSWQYGKYLTKCGATTFAYDGLGRRASKDNIKFIYDNDGRLIAQSDGLQFIYDNAGVVGFIHNGTQYFYRKDVQGNIIAILDNTGALVVKYVYDAWGNHAVLDADGHDIEAPEHIGNKNPFRYRGYYYDVETGFYYLQTRYYDPEVGRFISQDSIEFADPESINGLNLYAYCGNNPVMNIDPTGEFFLGLLIGALIAGVITGSISAISTAVNGGSALESLGAFVGGFITGGVLGAAAILGGGLVVGAFSVTVGSIIGMSVFLTAGTFAAGMGAYYAENWIKGEKTNLGDAFKNGAVTFTQGLFSFGIGAALGVGGFYNSLKPGNGIMDYVKIFSKGFGGFKSLIYGTTGYIVENAYPMFIRTIIKTPFVSPWNLIKP